MIAELLRAVDEILSQGAQRRAMAFRTVLLAGMFYGAVMGSYAGDAAPRPLMMLFSALKVPFLLVVTCALSLPSWYVLHALLGLRDDFPYALGAVVNSQAAFTLVLVALAPVVVLLYLGFSDYAWAILFNGIVFALATLGAQLALRRAYWPLIRQNPMHRWTMIIWLFVYVFVGIQMAWVLRPFIGDPGIRVELFRKNAWDNAYVFVIRLVLERFGMHSR